MGKILNNLKRLGTAMTGKEIRSRNIANTIGEIADNYNGGGADYRDSMYPPEDR